MTRMRWQAAMALLLVAAALSGCAGVQESAMRRAMENARDSVRGDLLGDDALHVVLCGTGSPLPDPDRAGPCTAVFAGGEFVVVDTGPGAFENMQVWNHTIEKRLL